MCINPRKDVQIFSQVQNSLSRYFPLLPNISRYFPIARQECLRRASRRAIKSTCLMRVRYPVTEQSNARSKPLYPRSRMEPTGLFALRHQVRRKAPVKYREVLHETSGNAQNQTAPDKCPRSFLPMNIKCGE